MGDYKTMKTKQFQVTYKFSDVIDTIIAKDKKEAIDKVKWFLETRWEKE